MATTLQVTPRGRLVASGDGVLSVLDSPADEEGAGGAGTAAEARCEFRTDSRCRAIVLGARTTLLAEEADDGRTRVTWLDMTTRRALDSLEVDATVTACAQADGELYALAIPGSVHVVWPHPTGQRDSVFVPDQGVTCLTLRAERTGSVLLAAGHQDGSVSLTRVTPGATLEPLWRRQLHDGPVSAVLLDAEERLITGGSDRSVCVTGAAMRPDAAEPAVHRLHLTLRCKNVRYEGVRTEREQARLREYAQSPLRGELAEGGGGGGGAGAVGGYPFLDEDGLADEGLEDA
jgi:hypothetical protein